MYLKHWNLRRRPFTTAFDPELVFYREPFAELLLTLTMIARIAPETVWLVGRPGSGKSTLLNSLREAVQEEVRFKMVFGGLLRGQSQFIEQIELMRTGEWSAHRSAIPVLEDYFLSEEATDRPVFIAIEDADKIKDEPTVWECSSLFDLPRERGWPITVMFTGSRIPESLQPLPQRPAKELRLPIPSGQEIRAIIEHRLIKSGAEEEIFTSEAVQTLIELSGKNLNKLLLLCDLSMQIGFISGNQRIGNSLIREKVEPYARKFFTDLDLENFEETGELDIAVAQPIPRSTLNGLAEIRSQTNGLHEAAIDVEDEQTEDGALEEKAGGEEDQAEPDNGKSNESNAAEAAGEDKLAKTSRILYRAELQSYRLASLGSGTTPEIEAGKETRETKSEEAKTMLYSDLPPENLYSTALELVRNVLQRLRAKEFADLTPIRHLSKAIADSQAAEDQLLKLTVRDEGERDLDIHLVNVAILSTTTGRRYGLSREELESLCEIALIHDVGHLHCREELLRSQDRFDREDFKAIKKHPQIGYELIKNKTNGSDIMAEVVLQEHERESGLGYPNYLEGNEIHLFAKIIGMCDVFEALTHSRAHRKALSPAAALGEINALRRSRTTFRVFTALQSTVQTATASAG
jgi:HD-GYP domain-containing protein (c-di-GMP phosphodiesterase class II)